ncbi:MAG: DUF4139 domain-containing protein [Burkholderiales bacterium]|jgi:hypothetical protein|nr:DUF4139 domain-containing protein [Burkholderiales bacterium]
MLKFSSRFRSLILCSTMGIFATAAATAVAQSVPVENISRAEDRKAVAVTIYNESLALIREEREVTLNAGRNLLALREVSGQIKPETASLRSLGNARLTLLEQNFDFDLLTPQKLLDKYVGKIVTIVRSNEQSDKETRERATVLANNQGVVLQYADRIETNLPANARIVYNDVPATLRDRPTLVVDLDSDKSGAQRTELSYLSGGLSWKADYVASLADDEKNLDLAGWVTLTNKSGAAYENAKLQLVAGDINRVQENLRVRKQAMVYETAAQAPAPSMAREELFEYHLYTLGRTTTLRDQQTKQVALLSAARVPVKKEYRMEGAQHWFYSEGKTPERGDKRGVEIFIEFDNKGGDLGQPLPKGIVRVYKKDKEGRPLFIGEDQIDHTPKNEQVRLKLGKAFDITGNWKRTDFSRISKRITEQEIAIELSNAKDVPATVRVVEPVPGDWKILKESHPHIKSSANSAMWDVSVPADGKTALKYRVRTEW